MLYAFKKIVSFGRAFSSGQKGSKTLIFLQNTIKHLLFMYIWLRKKNIFVLGTLKESTDQLLTKTVIIYYLKGKCKRLMAFFIL